MPLGKSVKRYLCRCERDSEMDFPFLVRPKGLRTDQPNGLGYRKIKPFIK